MSILGHFLNKRKADEGFRVLNKANEDAANEMFPTEGHTNAAIRMQDTLDKGQLTPDQLSPCGAPPLCGIGGGVPIPGPGGGIPAQPEPPFNFLFL